MHRISRLAAALFVAALPWAATWPAPAAAEDVPDRPTAPTGAEPHRPEVCTERYEPVCGKVDGVSKIYSNACFARAAGAKVISAKPCVDGTAGPKSSK